MSAVLRTYIQCLKTPNNIGYNTLRLEGRIMPPKEVMQLPQELREKMLVSGGAAWGWKFQDIPAVVKICGVLGFAIIGGTVMFILPGGTGEMNWLNAWPKKRNIGETWAQYVERSGFEFTGLFTSLVAKTDFEKEICELEFLRNKKESGVNVSDLLCFELGFVSESEYLTIYK